MAVIGSIRKRVGLLIGFIGVSLLAFILGDVFSSGAGIFGGNSDVVGEVADEKVHYSEFEKRVEMLTENYRINTQSDNIDQNTQDMLREQAWGMFVNENTLGVEYKKLGISVSPEELYEMCTGANPHAQVKQAFSDPRGMALKMTWAILAQNSTATNAQILAATDVALLTAVAGAVDVFADGV